MASQDSRSIAIAPLAEAQKGGAPKLSKRRTISAPEPERPESSIPVVIKVCTSELARPQLHCRTGNLDPVRDDFSPYRIIHQRAQFPKSPFTLPWASNFSNPCRAYSASYTNNDMLYCRPTSDNAFEEKLVNPSHYWRGGHAWSVLTLIIDGPPRPNRRVRYLGAILAHCRTRHGNLQEFPSHNDERQLLPGERMCGLMLLGGHRSVAKPGDVSAIRLTSITHSAIRTILVSIDSECETAEVTFRILKTVHLDDDMTLEDWEQLVFLATHRTLDMDGAVNRDRSPDGRPAGAVLRAEKASDTRIPSEGLGLPRSTEADRIFSRGEGGTEGSSGDSHSMGSSISKEA